MKYNYTVIIPHYNMPDLLTRCLKSIPVREDIQVIVVDDCSPDADKYKESYPELSRPYLELYSTPIGGSAGRARNIGLGQAKGKWLMFIDADDLLTDNAEKLLDENVNREEEVLFFNYLSVLSEDFTNSGNRTAYQPYFEAYQKDGREELFRYRHYPVWGKMIRLDLVKKHHIEFSETRYSNDVLFSLQCGYFAKRIGVVDKQMFLITQRQGSLASALLSKKKMSLKEYKIRTDVGYEAAEFLRRHHVNYQLIQYTSFSKGFFENYPIAFLFYFATKLCKFPALSVNVLKVIIITKFREIKKK